ncbi:MAG: dihydrolipoyl dehydrogenase [Acidobacteria bacterium]|nr:dihydrolipoyl dehydrogenase [Acidobacteriota bacterium]
MNEFDVIVIGGGPGGYVAAIKAAQLGLKTALAEKAPTFGGTCLNVGCIPTKVMVHSSELWEHIERLGEHGIVVEKGSYRFDMGALMKRKERIVGGLTRGIGSLLRKNAVTTFRGTAAFTDPHTVKVGSPEGGEELLHAKNIVVATGSVAKELPHIRFGGPVLSSTEMLSLDAPPKRLAVIGAGAVGVEFASIYAALGSEVTVVEMLPHLLPLEDEEVSVELEKVFKRRRIKYRLNSAVDRLDTLENGARLHIRSATGETAEADFDKVLLAVGRAPFTEGLDLDKAGLATERGYIRVDNYCRTYVPHIYAIGDVIPTPQLAHVASAEGITAAAHLAGRPVRPMSYKSIPACTYSAPQVGSVGMTEAKAKEMGYAVKVGRFPFMGVGKAKIEDMTDGFVKIVSDASTGEILGVHMIGAVSTELVGGMVLALNLECTAEELAQAVHPHPTVSEAVMEAAHAAHDKAIHL